MYIVWRTRLVKGNKTTSFLQDVIPHESVHVTPWKPLVCTHRGEGRVAWTPLIVHSERMGVKPTQTLLRRLPSLRSCCAADRFLRAAWWYDIEQTLGKFERAGRVESRPFYACDKKAILAKLREVVPRPTPAGVRDFTEYRMRKEQEHQARMARNRAKDEAFHAERLRREQEEARRQAEEPPFEQQWEEDFQQEPPFEQRWEQWNPDFWPWDHQYRQASSGQVAQPGCFRVLGLTSGATLEQVKGRYRELAKRHHPDRGGDPKQFNIIVAAYDEACAILARRTPA